MPVSTLMEGLGEAWWARPGLRLMRVVGEVVRVLVVQLLAAVVLTAMLAPLVPAVEALMMREQVEGATMEVEVLDIADTEVVGARAPQRG